MSRKFSVPTVFYFCPRNQLKGDDALRTMLTSIVAQLVRFLPERGSTSTDLSHARFSSISQPSSVVELIRLIRDLRKAGPRYIHCVVDTLHILEDQSDKEFTIDLSSTIDMLCNLTYNVHPQDREGNDNEDLEGPTIITKTVFTTDGIMGGLSQVAEIDLVERVEYDVVFDHGKLADFAYLGF